MHVVCNIIRLLLLKILSLIVSELPHKLLSLLSTLFTLLTDTLADDEDDSVVGDDDDSDDAVMKW